MSSAAFATALALSIGAALRPRAALRRPIALVARSEPLTPNQPAGPLDVGGRPCSPAGRPTTAVMLGFRRPAILTPADLAEWCDALSRAVRSGATLTHAVRSVSAPAAVAEALSPALLALERGVPLTTALAAPLGRSPHLDLVLVVLRTCSTHGGAAAEPLDRAAAALRQRAAVDAERRIHSAQATVSARVMTLLPGAMLLVLAATSDATRAVIASPTGGVVITIGAALNVAGWLWMRRLISGVGR
jgi:tight adherence protein B